MNFQSRGALNHLSPSPEASEGDPVTRQLLSEARTSSQPNPPGPTAIASANLLNAARIEQRPLEQPLDSSSSQPQILRGLKLQSNPGNMASGGQTEHKLKRPNFTAGNLVKLVAKKQAPRRDVYDFPEESPEKGRPYKLPEQVNHKPLKVVKTKGSNRPKGVQLTSELVIRSSSPQQANAIGAELDSVHVKAPAQRKSGRIAGDEPDISEIDWEKRPESLATITKTTHAKRKAEGPSSEAGRVSKSPKRTQIKTTSKGQDGTLSKRAMPPRIKRTVPQVVITGSDTSQQKSSRNIDLQRRQETRASAEVAQTQMNHPDFVPESNGRIRDDQATSGYQELAITASKSKLAPKRGRPRKVDPSQFKPSQARDGTSHHTPLTRGKSIQMKKRSKGASATIVPATNSSEANGASVAGEASSEDSSRSEGNELHENEIPEENNHDEEADGGADEISSAEEVEEQDSQIDRTQLSPLERMFEFAGSGERRGRCKTKTVRSIHQLCRKAREIIDKLEPDLSDVAQYLEGIISGLANVHDSQDEDEQRALKFDIYRHLFYSLACLFKAFYVWSSAQYDDPLHSIPTLRIILPFASRILLLKDIVTSWKVDVPQRGKGDRTVRNVTENFIAPLRKVVKESKATLTNLETAEDSHRIQEQFRVKRNQEQELQDSQAEAERLRKQKWERWQYLHLVRQKCETSLDAARRRHLFICKFDDLQERDANGVPFEREPILCERQTPFANRASPSEETEWSNTQNIALLDGLRQYSGPTVFEQIFHEYCRPGGPLRDFNVMEITSQAAYLRSSILDDYKTQGWQVDDWMQQIPVLP